MKYAAIMIPLFLIGYFIVQKNRPEPAGTVQVDTFNDPQKAIAEAEKALLLLSKNMNDGLAELGTLKLFEEVKKSDKIKEQKSNHH
jgi:hypothetical protein